MSASVVPVAEVEEHSAHNSPGSTTSNNVATDYHVNPQKIDLQISRHGTPLATIEGSPVQQSASLAHGDYKEDFPILRQKLISFVCRGLVGVVCYNGLHCWQEL